MRKALYPFSILYDGITRLRNRMYDRNILKSRHFGKGYPRIICVGNLSTGGTGKTPMTAYLIRSLSGSKRIAVLSRGYGRRTKGFREVRVSDTAEDVGDEPLLLKRKFPETTVAVDGKRVRGVERLKNRGDVVLLDDGMQHRKVRPDVTILLTTYGDLYTDDCLLPAGNLRESGKNARRADIIVVTKCPNNPDTTERESIISALAPLPCQTVCFSTISYGDKIWHAKNNLPLDQLNGKKFTLVTGIANPEPLVSYLSEKGLDFEHLRFADHHRFSKKELSELAEKDLILTTEKDFARLSGKIDEKKLFYLPVKTELADNVLLDVLMRLVG